MIINGLNRIGLLEKMLLEAATAGKEKVGIRHYIDQITGKPAVEIEIKTPDNTTIWYVMED